MRLCQWCFEQERKGALFVWMTMLASSETLVSSTEVYNKGNDVKEMYDQIKV